MEFLIIHQKKKSHKYIVLDFFRFILVANTIGGMMLSVLTFSIRTSGKINVSQHLKLQLTKLYLV
jgi:hypothetical protein